MDERVAVLLADANRHVQLADHLLTTTYPLVKDPKLLLSVLEHTRRAILDAMQCTVLAYTTTGAYELPAAAVAAPHAAFHDLLSIRRIEIDGAAEARTVLESCTATLAQHKDAHTAFPRDETLVLANDGFARLTLVDPVVLKSHLTILKRFVHGVNKHVATR